MSRSRQCYHRLATDGRWYMQVGNFEYAYEDCDCTWYGPFDSYDASCEYLSDHLGNTSGAEIEDSGAVAPPAEFVNVEAPAPRYY